MNDKFKPGKLVDFSREIDTSKLFTYLPTSGIKDCTINAKELIFTDVGNVYVFMKTLTHVANPFSLGTTTDFSESNIKNLMEVNFNEYKSSEEYSDKLSYESVLSNQIAYRTENTKVQFETCADVINYMRGNDELIKLLYDINSYIKTVKDSGDVLFKARKESESSTIVNIKDAMQILTKQNNLLTKYFAASEKELMKAQQQLEVLGLQAKKINY